MEGKGEKENCLDYSNPQVIGGNEKHSNA